MIRVFVTNEVTLNTREHKIMPTNIYKYYHPVCWQKTLKKMIRKQTGKSFGVSELDTEDQELLNRKCNLCLAKLSERPSILARS